MQHILLEKLVCTRNFGIAAIFPCGHSSTMSIHQRIKEKRIQLGLSMEALATQVGLSSWQTVQQWEKEGGTAPKRSRLEAVAKALGVTPEWLLLGDRSSGPTSPTHPHRRIADFELVPADQTDGEVGEIEYLAAKGSCGGGFLNFESPAKGKLIKESTFFQRYGVKPSNLFAVYADGNSMADFIVDGDIVIFDRTKRAPVSGKIFLIDHPEGLRIKLVRRSIDGSWILESKNPDKRTYPDERLEPVQLELLKICGEFVYRQGG